MDSKLDNIKNKLNELLIKRTTIIELWTVFLILQAFQVFFILIGEVMPDILVVLLGIIQMLFGIVSIVIFAIIIGVYLVTQGQPVREVRIITIPKILRNKLDLSESDGNTMQYQKEAMDVIEQVYPYYLGSNKLSGQSLQNEVILNYKGGTEKLTLEAMLRDNLRSTRLSSNVELGKPFLDVYIQVEQGLNELLENPTIDHIGKMFGLDISNQDPKDLGLSYENKLKREPTPEDKVKTATEVMKLVLDEMKRYYLEREKIDDLIKKFDTYERKEVQYNRTAINRLMYQANKEYRDTALRDLDDKWGKLREKKQEAGIERDIELQEERNREMERQRELEEIRRINEEDSENTI